MPCVHECYSPHTYECQNASHASTVAAFLLSARAELKFQNSTGLATSSSVARPTRSIASALSKRSRRREEAGGKVIEFYPGQKLSKEEPNVKWDHNASDEVIAKVQAKLAQHKIKAVNYGVVGIPNDGGAGAQDL